MSHLRDVERHARSLTDIREIMNSMKSLAYMEARKLNRIVEAQRAVTANLLSAAADFLQFHADTMPSAPPATSVRIVLGTERGFCGNLNERLIAGLREATEAEPEAACIVIAVGRKLHGALENRPPPIDDLRLVEGAGVAEEATAVLDRIIGELNALQSAYGALRVSSLHHDSEGELQTNALLPPFESISGEPQTFAYPPLLNLDPAELLVALSDHYLFSALFEILYEALRSENLRRVTHLSDAVRHLDERREDLARRANALRQEEITEEIEVILLSAASIAGESGRG